MQKKFSINGNGLQEMRNYILKAIEAPKNDAALYEPMFKIYCPHFKRTIPGDGNNSIYGGILTPIQATILDYNYHNNLDILSSEIKYLLKNGLRLNADLYPYESAKHSNNAISASYWYILTGDGNPNVLKLLVNFGANLNLPNRGMVNCFGNRPSALELAKEQLPLSVVEYLTENSTPEKRCEYTYNRISLLLEPDSRFGFGMSELFDEKDFSKQLLSYGAAHNCIDKYYSLINKWISFLEINKEQLSTISDLESLKKLRNRLGYDLGYDLNTKLDSIDENSSKENIKEIVTLIDKDLSKKLSIANDLLLTEKISLINNTKDLDKASSSNDKKTIPTMEQVRAAMPKHFEKN